MRLLVAYATTHGQAAKVADRVADVARRRGDDVDVVRLGDHVDPSPARYDAAVCVGSVHRGHHQAELVRWVRDHHTALNVKPSAFLSVSLSAADDTDEARSDTRMMIDVLLDDTGWIPSCTLAVAGALRYRHYDLPTRILMRLIARRHGAPTDLDEDVEFTDWADVEQFTVAFLNHETPAEVPA
jgi:menaquinone-dependent protoporphyrinogen oxidase